LPYLCARVEQLTQTCRQTQIVLCHLQIQACASVGATSRTCTYRFVCRYTVHDAYSPRQIPIDNRAKIAVADTDRTEIPADLLDVHIAPKADPTATRIVAFGSRIGESDT
jgi:hypothetical protein